MKQAVTFRTLAIGMIAASIALGFMRREGRTADARLNVLLMVSDDLNCRLGCYGAAEARTPNIDRLAARGVRFDRAYCNYPVCNASRTSFLSGRFPEATGVLNNTTDPRTVLGSDFQFLPEYLRAHGYFSAGCGKIAHGRFSAALNWDYYSEPARNIDEDDEAAPGKKAGKKKGKAAAKSADPSVPFGWQATVGPDENEPDGQVARRLLKYFSEHQDKPFFIAAGLHKPHVPHTAPQKYFDLHNPQKMPVPTEPAAHLSGIPLLAQSPKYFPKLSVAERQAIIQHYYAATSFMDAQVGVLLDELDRLKLWDTTVVIFMSDHGWHLGEHGGFYAKMSLMDESARAPLIIAAPGVKPATTSAIAEYVDLFPTVAELTGSPTPDGLHGQSLVSILKQPTSSGKQAAYTVVRRGQKLARAVHAKDFTYIEWPDGTQQLYNAATDPHEYSNLSADKNYAATLLAMQQKLAERREQIPQQLRESR